MNKSRLIWLLIFGLVLNQNTVQILSSASYLAPLTKAPNYTAVHSTIKEIQVLFDRLSHILEQAEGFRLKNDFDLQPIRILTEKLAFSIQNQVDQGVPPQKIVNHAYLVYLYVLVDLFNTSFFLSDTYRENKEEVEEIVDELGNRFSQLSVYFYPKILDYRSLWVRYHQKMIGGILHEIGNKFAKVFTRHNLYERRGQGDLFKDLKKPISELYSLNMELDLARRNNLSREIQNYMIYEEDFVTVEEPRLFYMRTFLIRFNEIAKRLKPIAQKLKDSEEYLNLEDELKNFIDLTLNTADLIDTFINFYLKGREFPLTRLDLKEVIQKALYIFQVEKGVDLSEIVEIKYPKRSQLFIEGNSALFQQVMINLIKNAMEHAQPEKILIQAKIKGDKIVLEIENDSKKGVFIPPEKLEEVPFYGMRGKNLARLFAADFTRSNNVERGFGIKLAWQFVNAHRGSLSVRSNQRETRSVGKTIFTITVPKVKTQGKRSKKSARFSITVPGQQSGKSISGSDLDQALKALFTETGSPQQAIPSINFEWNEHPAAGLFVDSSV